MADDKDIVAMALGIWNGEDSRSGDPIGVTIHNSEHLFPAAGETSIEAAKGVCLDAARCAKAALEGEGFVIIPAARIQSDAATIAALREALGRIGAPAIVPLDKCPEGWRDIATERIDAARQALRGDP